MVFALCFEWDTAVWMMDFVYSDVMTNSRSQRTKDFLYNEYMPEFKGLVQDKRINWWSAIDVMFRFTGVLTKIMWAFIWQEETFIMPEDPDNWIYHDGQAFMASLTPHINWVASWFSGFPQTDEQMVIGKGIYPGSEFCNSDSPHALWHEQSANGFQEIMLLTDYIYGAIENK